MLGRSMLHHGALLCKARPAQPRARCDVQVGRVAYAALAACAHACGQKFEHLGYTLIPELFKQLVVAIVVVAESTDACMRAIVSSCHSGRILKLFTDALLNDKNPKLRHRCAEYMHQAMQEWPTSAFGREQQQLMRMGVTKAIEDASAGAFLPPPLSRPAMRTFLPFPPPVMVRAAATLHALASYTA